MLNCSKTDYSAVTICYNVRVPVECLAVTCWLLCQNSSTYWEGKSDAERLQRIYGISFPDTKQLKQWQKIQEEAAKRDHRKIGRVCFAKCWLVYDADSYS